jgi:hypothetical protein
LELGMVSEKASALVWESGLVLVKVKAWVAR